MARKIGDAFVRVRPDTKQMGDDVQREGRKHGRLFGSVFVRASAGPLRGIAGVVGASIGAVAAVGALSKFGSLAKESVAAASDLNETLSKSSVIWGQNAKAMERWGNQAATTVGLSKQQALEAAASFGNFLKQLGVAPKSTQTMSKGLIQLSADLASFNNIEGGTQEVADAFAAALRGEYDSLQRVLPAINAAAVETEALKETHKKSAKELTAAEKATALYTLAMRSAGPAIGDFARTSSGAANQQRIMNAEIQDAKARLGQGLLPIQAAFFKLVRTVGVPALDALGKIIGKATDAIESATAKSGGLSGVVDKIGKVAKAAFAIFRTEVIPRVIDLGRYIRDEALPRIVDLGRNLQALLVPAFRTMGDIVQNVILPAVSALGKFLVEKVIPAISGLIGWLAKHKDVALALAIAIAASLVPAFISWAIAAGSAAIATIAATAPILLAIGIVAALAFGIIKLAKNWDSVWNAIKKATIAFIGFLKANWPLILGILLGPIALAAALIFKYWDQISSKTRQAFNAVRSAVGTAVNWVKSTVSSAFGAVVSTVRTKFNEVIGQARGLLGRIRSAIGNATTALRQIGRDLIQGLINGIKSMVGRLVGSIGDALGKIPGAAKKILHIGSPSRLFRRFGQETVAGYVLGVNDQRGSLDRAIGDVLPTTPPSAPTSTVAGRGGPPSSEVVSAFERALERVLSRASLRLDDRTARFSDLLVRGG